jgi:hypothetical protein
MNYKKVHIHALRRIRIDDWLAQARTLLQTLRPLSSKPLHVESEVLTVVGMKNSIFWDITLCSPVKINRRFGGTDRLHPQGRSVSQARNYPGDSGYFSEMSVNFHRTTRSYIPEDRTLQKPLHITSFPIFLNFRFQRTGCGRKSIYKWLFRATIKVINPV